MDRYNAIIKQIQQNIKKQRKKMKMTQEALSKRLDKSRFWVTAIERGNIAPTILGLYQIADSLQCSIFNLLPPNYGENIVNSNIDFKTAGQVYMMLDETQREIQNEVIR